MRATWSRTAEVVLLLAAWLLTRGLRDAPVNAINDARCRLAHRLMLAADEATRPWRGVMASGSGCGWQRRSSGWRRGHRDASPGSLTPSSTTREHSPGVRWHGSRCTAFGKASEKPTGTGGHGWRTG